VALFRKKKIWNTVRVISYQFYLYINAISVLCSPNGTLFQTCLILHICIMAEINNLGVCKYLKYIFFFFSIVFISKHALHNWFYTLIENWCRNTQSVKNKVIHKIYVFFVTSRSRTFRFGRNKELVLTNKQNKFCKNLLFLRDTREKCFLRYREPATPGYISENHHVFTYISENHHVLNHVVVELPSQSVKLQEIKLKLI
jgi:hypothetical protein